MSAVILGACATEDSTACFWDATVHGTGLGQSFFEYDGIHVLVYVPKGFFIESVQVDAEHFFEPGYEHGPGYGVTLGQPDEPVATETITSTPSPSPEVDPLPMTGMDMTFTLSLVGVAVVCSAAGVLLAFWKGRKL